MRGPDLKKAMREEDLVSQSLARILSNAQGKKGDRPLVNAADALWASFEIILEELGTKKIEAPDHELLSERSRFEDTIEVMCEMAGIRSRQIKLAHLKMARGPILALMKDNQRPVVILTDRRGRHQVIDCVAGTETKVSSLFPDGFHEIAYYFYASLPKRPLQIRDLFGWAFRDLVHEWKSVFLFALCASFLGASYPVLIGILFDSVIPSVWLSGLGYVFAAIVVISFSHFLLSLALHQRIMRMLQRVSHDAQAAIVDRLLELSVKFFRQRSAGEVAFRAFSIDAIRQVLTDQVLAQAMLATLSVVNLFVLVYYSLTLALWVISAMLVYAFVVFLLFVFFQKADRGRQRSMSEVAGLEFQMLSGISKIRSAGAERRMFVRWLNASEKRMGEGKLADEISRLILMINAGSEVFVLALLLIAFKVHGLSSLTVGEFLAFLTAMTLVSTSVFRLGRMILQTLDVYPLAKQIRPILEAIPESAEAKNDPGILTGRIDLMHLSFRYDEGRKQVLYDVNLRVNPGEFVALVGASGSGKSTLLKLLLGFDIPTSGAIYFDGQDLSSLSIRKIRNQIGVVLQQGHLFPGSILDNIIGSSLLTMDDAWKAAAKCALDEDIRKLPMGMFTMIGEGGGGLSGGQRQRILIARAIARNPRILLFDEATSALDNVTQEIVTQSLNQLNVTRIVIAHRISTIKRANKICVLSGGRIVEEGGYEELVARNGSFAELVRRQMA